MVCVRHSGRNSTLRNSPLGCLRAVRGRDVHLTEVIRRESIRVSNPLQTSRRIRPPFSRPARPLDTTPARHHAHGHLGTDCPSQTPSLCPLAAPPTTAVYHDLGQVPGADPRHEGYTSSGHDDTHSQPRPFPTCNPNTPPLELCLFATRYANIHTPYLLAASARCVPARLNRRNGVYRRHVPWREHRARHYNRTVVDRRAKPRSDPATQVAHPRR